MMVLSNEVGSGVIFRSSYFKAIRESRNSDSLFMSRVVAYVSCDIDIGAAFETA